MSRFGKHTNTGFTLIELLVVIGILTVLLSIVLIAVNPIEQFNKTIDVSTETVKHDIANAAISYYISEKTLPWKKDPTCRQELAAGNTITDVPSCMQDLTGGGQLQNAVMSASETKDIYITECNDAIALCYNPKSQSYNQSSDAKYTKNGVYSPLCPSSSGTSKNCYTCTFSTNEAQECFQALNPHGTLAIVPSPSPGQPLPIPTRNTTDTCSKSSAGKIACMAKVVSSRGGIPFASINLPAGFGPDQIHTAYNLPCTPGGSVQSFCSTPAVFGPKTIAIVDAYQNPTLENDLAVYDQTYGLPPCTSTNGCLQIVNQSGNPSPLPSVDSNWALEEALDVQMAHAVCQTCKILVVEASSNTFADIGIAENQAAAMGANAISNSYGAPAFSGETNLDTYYDHPGTFVTVSSGDWGYGEYYPAASKHVISVGGTTLSLLPNNTYASESVWSGAGSGCSAYEPANSYQTSLSNWGLTGCGSNRSITDVSAVADPNTGVTTYDSTEYGGHSGWWILGGTSVSSPIISASLILTGNAPLIGDSAALLYANASKFRDVTQGLNGNCWGAISCIGAVGYDGPTGLGSPNFLSGSLSNPTPTPQISPTPSPSITPTVGPIQTQVWVANANNIVRFNTDGTSAGSPYSIVGLIRPSSIARINSQIWVVDFGSKYIFRLNSDGSSAAGPITGPGSGGQYGIAVAGNQVWVPYTNYSTQQHFISRYNLDGTSAGSPLSGNGINYPENIATVGTQVWVLNHPFTTQPENILRFNFDGTSAGTPLSRVSSDFPMGIGVVGSQVWVTVSAASGGYYIDRYNFDGTISGSPITGNGLANPVSVAVVGSQVWVVNNANGSISRFNPDGTSAGSPLTGMGNPWYLSVIQ